MQALVRRWHGLRWRLSQWAASRAAHLDSRHPRSADRWLRWAARLAPGFGSVHRRLVEARRRTQDRLGAVALARRITRRFEHSADAWVLLGETYVGAFRPREALMAFERALQIEERPDAAMAAGQLYAQRGDPITAGARYARAFAAGAGPEALRANAKMLRAAGDLAAARQAQELWERVTGRPWPDD